ncbi:MAG: hypothetical protein Q9227_002852 [Pyrenula ochraceoflavens]
MRTSLILLAAASLAAAVPSPKVPKKLPRQLPAEPTGVKSVTSPNGVTIRYKEPGTEGICETTPGVNSYSGYVDLDANTHVWFWFFESRSDPANDPVTLWLNGGPGSDSQIGLFQELGPCNVTQNLTTQYNPYAWNNVSNMLFLSQPLGVGFSYGYEFEGSENDFTGEFQNASAGPVDGRYPSYDPSIDTTNLAAVAAWEVLQGFYSALPQLDSEVTSTEFNLATESYGGHYGPGFFYTFYEGNEAIRNGSAQGKLLEMNSLTIINGIIDEAIQAPYYPIMANNNTYGIKAYNDTVYNYANFALTMPNGCLDQYAYCKASNRTSPGDLAICTEASNMCRDNVEGVYYQFSDRGTYNIRNPSDDPTPPDYFEDFLNLASTQEAIGVDLNYTATNNAGVYYGFQQTGDQVWPNFIEDLETLLDLPVRVSLIYGDADYICNWLGGQAVSLAANYSGSAQFAAAGYTPMLVDGVEYGETREYGNFSFTRVYEAGHEVPYYQPLASLQLFNRTINGYDTATGMMSIKNVGGTAANYSTSGDAMATHTESYVSTFTPSATAGSL